MEALSTATKVSTASPASHHQNKTDVNAKDDAIKMLPPVFYQAKLTVGAPDDPLEREADAMADKVMRMPMADPVSFSYGKNIVNRKCTECEEEEKLYRKESGSETTSIAPPIVHDVLNSSGGKTLDADTRAYMEPRFNYDFNDVKIHDNNLAAKSASSINALAYTSGNNVVFNSGQYNTDSESGKRLLAHELTHVVQQENSDMSIKRQVHPSQVDFVDQRDGAPNAVNCGPTPGCPPSFCEPYPSQNLAIQQRARMTPILLAGIAAFVDSRVVPLWGTYLSGGSAPQNLTGRFGSDFTTSPTTVATTQFLVNAIRSRLVASPPSFIPGLNLTIINISSLISTEIGAINTPGDAHEMNFNLPGDIAGNIAGGIGTNQTACAAGARPSPFNDERIATGMVQVTRDVAGNLTVVPFINYQVKDTIDLCPGNCGTSTEQIATIPMSQFEATGISGDVPFTIDFPANALPFTIPHP